MAPVTKLFNQRYDHRKPTDFALFKGNDSSGSDSSSLSLVVLPCNQKYQGLFLQKCAVR